MKREIVIEQQSCKDSIMGFFTEQESGAAAVTGGADGSSELWKYSPAAGQGKNTGKKKRQSHREV